MCDKKGGKTFKPEIEESNQWNMICGFGEVGGNRFKTGFSYVMYVIVTYIYMKSFKALCEQCTCCLKHTASK